MTVADVIALAALCLSIAGTGIGTTWYLATLLTDLRSRVTAIEQHLGLAMGLQRTQRRQSAVRVVGLHHETMHKGE
ncbi:MAG TPA: hypothetical protein VGG10_15315 [Rhizomicrobium sp.]|jgi:hypothetical protein